MPASLDSRCLVSTLATPTMTEPLVTWRRGLRRARFAVAESAT
jgi:hypothetical protein